jgi:hypothetical protein
VVSLSEQVQHLRDAQRSVTLVEKQVREVKQLVSTLETRMQKSVSQMGDALRLDMRSMEKRLEARVPSHSDQGNIVVEEFTSDQGAMVDQLQEGSILALQLEGSDLHLALTEANDTITVDYISWVAVNDDVSQLHECLFVCNYADEDSFLLQSVVQGDYLVLTRNRAFFAGGSIVLTTQDEQQATRFSLQQHDDHIRLLCSKQHLVYAPSTAHRSFLAARSILPEPCGRFLLKLLS